MRLIILSTLSIATLTGCSFRAPAPQYGEILSLSVVPWNYGTVRTIHAQVRFIGDVEPPKLAIAPGASGTTIQLLALSQLKGHFMDFGIFPVDSQTPRVFDLETDVALRQSGTYRIEGLRMANEGAGATVQGVSVSTEVQVD
jgi:hypothetical protein